MVMGEKCRLEFTCHTMFRARAIGPMAIAIALTGFNGDLERLVT